MPSKPQIKVKKRTKPEDDDALLQKAASEKKESYRQEVEDHLNENIFYGLSSLIENAETAKQLAIRSTQAFHFAVLVAGLLAVVAAVGWSRDVGYRYFHQLPNGSVVEAAATGRPIITNAVLNRFGAEVAAGFHTFTYRNYLERFRDMRDYCSDDVVTGLYKRLKSTGAFTTANDYRQRYEAVTTSMNVVQQWPQENPTKWELRGVVNEEIISETGKPIMEDFSVIIRVETVPLDVSPRGIQCVQINENFAK